MFESENSRFGGKTTALWGEDVVSTPGPSKGSTGNIHRVPVDFRLYAFRTFTLSAPARMIIESMIYHRGVMSAERFKARQISPEHYGFIDFAPIFIELQDAGWVRVEPDGSLALTSWAREMLL